jgi:RimJ/RimL family protein N-acetyltransferase
VEVTVRKLTVEDAPRVHTAIVESVDHLRPWMPWVATDPMTLEWRTEWISTTASEGIFVGSTFVGGVGLHDRISPTGREIGYWVRAGWTRRGVATAAVRIMIEQAFALPGVDHVEIHHDKANVASAGVPAKLGFVLVREVPDAVAAPGECGISCEWRLCV